MRRPGASAPGRRSPPVSRRAPSSGWRRPSAASPPTTCPFPASRGRRAMFPTLCACLPPRARRSPTDRHRGGERAMDVVNLVEKLSRFTEHWSPKIVGEVNDMQVKLVKFAGEFVWHHHDREDELFFVVAG